MTRRDPRDGMVHYSRKVYARGWVANHDGNLTARLGPDRVLATPTAFSKDDVTGNDLIIVNDAGERVSGHQRPFSELDLHLAVYKTRPDVKAVLHAHPPFATALAVAGRGLDRPFIAEAVVSLGERVPLLPFTLPRAAGWTQPLIDAAPWFDAVLLQNHGVLTWGDSLEQAFLRMELVEHLATILHHTAAFGGPRFLDDAAIPPLLAARKKAGLGPEARGLAPAPRAAASHAPAPGRDQIARLVAEEIQKLTQGS